MKSMTGYGRSHRVLADREITAEIRGVNHRFLDCTVKAPRMCGFLEDAVKKSAGQQVSRGKLDIFISVAAVGESNTKIIFNGGLAAQYLAALTALRDRFNVRDDVSVMTLARMPDVMTMEKEEEDAERLQADVLVVFSEALAEFDAMRAYEGERLTCDIQSRKHTILQIVSDIETRSPSSVQVYREKLEKRMREALSDTEIDPQRILAEAALYADKTAVDEETVRLRSHMEQLELMMDEGTAVGRKMDFLVQEMNREANTIGSKANDVVLARLVVELKAEIEKIREQVQNIE